MPLEHLLRTLQKPARTHFDAADPSSGEAVMVNRDEYVNKLKSQLDQWNAEVAKWETQAKQAQASVQAEYQKQLQQYRSRRDEALAQLRKVQSASAEAWSDMTRGTDEAWKKMHEAFNQARSRFDKK